jgi:hypothetical protein
MGLPLIEQGDGSWVVVYILFDMEYGEGIECKV